MYVLPRFRHRTSTAGDRPSPCRRPLPILISTKTGLYITLGFIDAVTVRKRIPDPVRNLVLLEAGYKCANPTCRHILTLELHHIVRVKDGGANNPESLLALCPNCHSLHTQGHIPAHAIRTWKSLLLALNSANHVTADLLLMLAADEERVASGDRKTVAPRFRFTGDGLPALAGLLSSGLITISADILEQTRGGVRCLLSRSVSPKGEGSSLCMALGY